MADFDNNLRQYDKIRFPLRNLYIYGCYPRELYVQQFHTKDKTFRESKKLIQAFLPGDFFMSKSIGHQVINYCRYDMFDGTEEYLAHTYLKCTFAENDIIFYFATMACLADQQMHTVSEILETCDDIVATTNMTTSSVENLRNHLAELVEEGVILRVGEGKKLRYMLCKDVLNDFTDTELRELMNLSVFLYNTQPFGLPFYLLKNRLVNYYRVKYLKDEYKSLFQYRNNHLFNVLDSEIMLKVLSAIHTHSLISYDYINNGDECEKQIAGIPIRVIHNAENGRQYVIVYDEEKDKVYAYRLERVKNVKVGEIVTSQLWETALEKGNSLQTSWCVAGLNEKPIKVVIDFYLPQDKMYIVGQLKCEEHKSTLVEVANGHYRYELFVGDPKEMIPWIRGFGEYAHVQKSSEHNLAETLQSDWEEALKNYGTIQQV